MKYVFLAFYRSGQVDTYFCGKEFYDFNEMKEFSAEHSELYKGRAKDGETYYSTYYKIKELF